MIYYKLNITPIHIHYYIYNFILSQIDSYNLSQIEVILIIVNYYHRITIKKLILKIKI